MTTSTDCDVYTPAEALSAGLLRLEAGLARLKLSVPPRSPVAEEVGYLQLLCRELCQRAWLLAANAGDGEALP